ncbi:MAG: hypothetical protein K0Q50_706 [Vampirovibrio sp.]|jgi:hypothetical protein|nr:hypothetical protein [Vampirovibrio sp.]
MDIAYSLDQLVPAAQYRGSLTANTQQAYEAITWEDEREKPTWEAIQEVPAEAAPLYNRVKTAFSALSLELQIKYKDEIRDGAFFLKEGNLPMLGVIVSQAEAKYDLPADQSVKDIVDTVKAELAGD